MKRFYIFKDRVMIGATPTREQAISFIRQEQQFETHYMLKASFSIIEGTEEFVDYQKCMKEKNND